MEKIKKFLVGEKVKLLALIKNNKYDIVSSYKITENLDSLTEISAEIIAKYQLFEGTEGTVYMCRIPENSIGFIVSNWHVMHRNVNEKHVNYKFVDVPGWAINCSPNFLKELINEN